MNILTRTAFHLEHFKYTQFFEIFNLREKHVEIHKKSISLLLFPMYYGYEL